MDENLHDIDKLFRNQIEAHQESPPAGVWENIDKHLDKEQVVSLDKKYKKLRLFAACLLFALLGTAAYELVHTHSQEKVAAETNKVNKQETSGKENRAEDLVTEEQTDLSSHDPNAKRDIINKAGAKNRPPAVVSDKDYQQKKSGENTADNRSVATVESATRRHKKTSQVGRHNPKELPETNNNSETADIVQETAIWKKALAGNVTVGNNNNQYRIDDQFASAAAIRYYRFEPLVSANTPISSEVPGAFRLPQQPVDPINTALAETKHLPGINRPLRTGPKLSVTAFFAPQLSFNRLENDDHGSRPGGDREHIERDEQHPKASTFGALVGVTVAKKWLIQSGLTYASKTTDIEPKKVYADLDNDGRVKYRFDCSSGYAYFSPKTGGATNVGDSAIAKETENTLHYIGIPIMLGYKLSWGKFSIYPTVGATAKFLVKQKIETELEDGSSKERQAVKTIEGLRKTYFSSLTSIAFEYSFNNRIALNLSPTANFALSSITRNATVKSYPNSFNIAAGLRVNF